jgi:hypothetical protein
LIGCGPLIHEVHGEQRGGLPRAAARWVWVMLIIAAVVEGYLHLVGLSTDFGSAFIPVASVMSLMVVSAQVLPLLGVNRPLAGRRLAWLLWLRTQVEEVAVVGESWSPSSPSPSSSSWSPRSTRGQRSDGGCGTLLAMFALLPFARWIRLRTIDVDPRMTRSHATPMISAVFFMGQAATMLVLFGVRRSSWRGGFN